jgi:hypothetical protein
MGGMEYIDLTQDRDRCPPLVNAVMNMRFLFNAWYFLTG